MSKTLEEKNAHRRAYYAANRDRILAQRVPRKDEISAYNKNYHATHREQASTRKKATNALPESKEKRRAHRIVHAQEIKSQGATYRAEHEKEIKEYGVAYYAANKEQMLAYDRAHRPRKRDKYLRRRFGISIEEFNAMISRQSGACAICKRPDWNGKSPHVDHDHGSGKVRGVLCSRCNIAVGLIFDNPSIANAMTVYLLQHNAARHVAKEKQNGQ